MRPRGHFRMHFTQLSDMAGGYWFFCRYSVRGVTGYVCHMERRLSEMECKSMERYGDVQIFSGSVKSVPERRFDVVFLDDAAGRLGSWLKVCWHSRTESAMWYDTDEDERLILTEANDLV